MHLSTVKRPGNASLLMASFFACVLAGLVACAGPVGNSDPLNATYTIEGKEISLRDGRSETPISRDSATKVRTFVSGKPVPGDLDGDGVQDAALILVHDPGGSGTFYYVAGAIDQGGRYRGTHAVLIGDRISVDGLSIADGVVTVHYKDRRAHEPMSMRPSAEKTLSLFLDNDKLISRN